jgi:hypothetical protein
MRHLRGVLGGPPTRTARLTHDMWTLLIILTVGANFGAVHEVRGFVTQVQCEKAKQIVLSGDWSSHQRVNLSCLYVM